MLKSCLTKGPAAALILILVGCDDGYSNDGGVAGATLPEGKVAVTVRTVPGAQPQAAFLVVPQRDFNPTDLAAAVRKAGLACERVRGFNELEQNGKRTGIYKVDCLEYSYQYTTLSGKTHGKRWSGTVNGE